MSHRDDCPSRGEAERRGERDYERRGYRSYSGPEEYEDCREAQRYYQDGQRRAEYRAEEEAEHERAVRRSQAQRERAEAEMAEESETFREQYPEDTDFYYQMLAAEAEVADLHAQF